EPVGRALVARAVAALRHVARTCGRPADGGALGIRRTLCAAARARFGDVAVAGRRAADRAGADEAVRRTGRARPVAELVHVAGAGGGPADGALPARLVNADRGARRPVAGVGRARVRVTAVDARARVLQGAEDDAVGG